MKSHLYKWLSRRPHRDIFLGGKLYMTKYYLGKWFGFPVVLHIIYQPDLDRAYHNHPWACFSLILKGTYIEDRVTHICPKRGPSGKLIFRSVCNYIPAHALHRIAATDGVVWTLFFMGRKQGSWGFLRDREVPSTLVPRGQRREWYFDPEPEVPTTVRQYGTCPIWLADWERV